LDDFCWLWNIRHMNHGWLEQLYSLEHTWSLVSVENSISFYEIYYFVTSLYKFIQVRTVDTGSGSYCTCGINSTRSPRPPPALLARVYATYYIIIQYISFYSFYLSCTNTGHILIIKNTSEEMPPQPRQTVIFPLPLQTLYAGNWCWLRYWYRATYLRGWVFQRWLRELWVISTGLMFCSGYVIVWETCRYVYSFEDGHCCWLRYIDIGQY
jgi:hypothetical protein